MSRTTRRKSGDRYWLTIRAENNYNLDYDWYARYVRKIETDAYGKSWKGTYLVKGLSNSVVRTACRCTIRNLFKLQDYSNYEYTPNRRECKSKGLIWSII